jgi:lysophospholipase L1-like esterase
MKHVLVYGDSLSWGIVPNTRQRLPFLSRWPGVMENELTSLGQRVRVIEDCLNGRRTAWSDPFKPGRNGLDGLEQRIEINSPLALVIVMLGTNDFQSMHSNNAWLSAQGLGQIIRTIRNAPIEPGMPVPPILVVVPPPIGAPSGPIAPKFEGGDTRCRGLSDAYAQVSSELKCAFFDAASVITSSARDGVHIDEAHHAILGRALSRPVYKLLHNSHAL